MIALTKFVVRFRWPVIAVWILLIGFGGFASGKLTDRYATDFSIPSHAAYEANARVYKVFGNGRQYPVQVVYHADSDLSGRQDIAKSIADTASAAHGSRFASYYDTQGSYFLSKDRKTTYATIYPYGIPSFSDFSFITLIQKSLKKTTPPGVTSQLTGAYPVALSIEKETGPGIWKEVLLGGLGALIVLILIFSTLPAVLMPLMVAICSIMTTYAAVWSLTYVTDVSVIVQFLIGLVGLGIAIDYSLLVIFRYRDELEKDQPAGDALIQTMTHAGHSVVVSGSTVAIGLVSMILVPVPFIRSIGLGGMLIPVVSVIAAVTLLPAVLSLLGHRINRLHIFWPVRAAYNGVRNRTPAGRPIFGNASATDAEASMGKFWPAWAAAVVRRPWPFFLVGIIIVGLLVFPAFHMNPGNSQLANEPAKGDAAAGLKALAKVHAPKGAFGPVNIVVEGKATDEQAEQVADAARGVKGVAGAVAPQKWHKGDMRIIEVTQKDDPATSGTTHVIDDLNHDVVPKLRKQLGSGVKVTVAGAPAEDRDFVHAVYDNFPIVLGFVVLLTFLLLARALRSIVLPLKAVILNLLSLGSAYGVITFVFQDGHLSNAIWGFRATDSIVAWIPLMIFAFLFGISMDYEVFMLTRMREIYDETGETKVAVAEGLARTGKLVTSAAAILMFTFIVLSTSPGPDFKEFAIGLAAGIIIDATIIRVLLVPALVTLLGRANWWFPNWARVLLLLPKDPHSRGSDDNDPRNETPSRKMVSQS